MGWPRQTFNVRLDTINQQIYDYEHELSNYYNKISMDIYTRSKDFELRQEGNIKFLKEKRDKLNFNKKHKTVVDKQNAVYQDVSHIRFLKYQPQWLCMEIISGNKFSIQYIRNKTSEMIQLHNMVWKV